MTLKYLQEEKSTSWVEAGVGWGRSGGGIGRGSGGGELHIPGGPGNKWQEGDESMLRLQSLL